MANVPRVGLIGVGNMGMPVARRLRSAGYSVDFFARRAEVIVEAKGLGAQQAETRGIHTLDAAMMGSAAALVEGARKYIEKDLAVCAEVAAEIGANLGSVLTVAQEICGITP